MKFTFILTLALLLVSCGGGGDSGNNITVSTSTTIELQIYKSTSNLVNDEIPVVGVSVQLDYDGIVITTDQDGFVTFTINDADKHDIHVFSDAGYEWQSIYNIKTGVLQRIKLMNTDSIIQTSRTSFLSFKGKITDYVPENKYEFYFYQTRGNAHKGSLNPTFGNFGVDYQIYFEFTMPAASEITGDIVVLEYQYDMNTKEDILINSTLVPATSPLTVYTTNAANDNYILHDDIVFTATAPMQSEIITIDGLIVPLKSTFTRLDVSRSEIDSAFDSVSQPVGSLYRHINADMVYPKTLKSYSSYDYTQVAYQVSSIVDPTIYQLIWTLSDVIDRNSVVNIRPDFTVLPELAADQTGEIIKWVAVDKNLTRLNLRLSEVIPTPQLIAWNLTLDPSAVDVRLPKVPADIGDILDIGQNYVIQLTGGNKVDNRMESFTLTSKNWSR